MHYLIRVWYLLGHDESSVGLSIAQHHAQLAEQTVETTMFNVGQVTKPCAKCVGFAKAAISVATSVPSQMEGKMASLILQAELITLFIIEEMSQRLSKDWNR